MEEEKKEETSIDTNVEDNDALEKEEEDKNKPKKRKNKKVGRTVLNIITFILFVVIVLEAVIGIVNMQRINNNEDPIWYISTKTEETDLKTVVEYNLGLYKIVKTDTAKETKITLKPFFLES